MFTLVSAKTMCLTSFCLLPTVLFLSYFGPLNCKGISFTRLDASYSDDTILGNADTAMIEVGSLVRGLVVVKAGQVIVRLMLGQYVIDRFLCLFLL